MEKRITTNGEKENLVASKVTPEEAKLIRLAADKEFMSVSAFVRKSAVRNSREVLSEN